MPQADSSLTTDPCKPGCACPDCLAVQEAEAERLGPDREPEVKDLAALRRDLRDCFEGCIPLRDAIAMIGAADHPQRDILAADYRQWTARFKAGQRAW